MTQIRSLTPALDENEARQKREAIELCGKNRGPHDYVPIEWRESEEVNLGVQRIKRVTRFLCRVCFNTIDTSTLISMYKDLSHP